MLSLSAHTYEFGLLSHVILPTVLCLALSVSYKLLHIIVILFIGQIYAVMTWLLNITFCDSVIWSNLCCYDLVVTYNYCDLVIWSAYTTVFWLEPCCYLLDLKFVHICYVWQGHMLKLQLIIESIFHIVYHSYIAFLRWVQMSIFLLNHWILFIAMIRSCMNQRRVVALSQKFWVIFLFYFWYNDLYQQAGSVIAIIMQ